MKLLLIDGSNLIFRAYYASENQVKKNKEGISVSAVKTAMSMLENLIKKENPTHIFIALDSGKATFRHKMYAEYKGKRESAPEQLKAQFPLIIDLFTSLGIKHFATDEYEADDLIASYAKYAKQFDIPTKVITGDKDLLQLVDETTRVLTPKMGFAKECDYDVQTFVDKYTFSPRKMIEYKALVGDPSDNIIGVPKLGDKTAKKLLDQYETIEAIIEAAKNEEIKGKLQENIITSEQQIYLNVKLVTLVDTTEIPFEIENLEFLEIEYQTYGEFLRLHGFVKEYNDLIDLNLFDESLNQNDNYVSFENIKYTSIENFNVKEHIGLEDKQEVFLYTQTLTENYFLSEKLGIAFCSAKGNFYLPSQEINEEFQQFLLNDQPKVIYDCKKMLGTYGMRINNIVFDPFLAIALMNPGNYGKEFTNVFSDLGIHYVKPENKIYGTKANPKVLDRELMERDLVSKVVATKETHQTLKEQIKFEEVERIYYDIELPLAKSLADMEINGVVIDVEKLTEVEVVFQKENDNLEEQIKAITNININSPMQIANLLFDTWALPKMRLKKTTTGISTDMDNLEKLKVILKADLEKYQTEIKFLNLLSKYRKNKKILSTYLKNMKKFIREDQKIHPINNQLSTETGRLSVVDPNIQNMPIKGEFSSYIRSLFKGNSGNKIIAFDYSQIELRIMAVFADDQNMIQAFNDDRDIHEETAKKIFDLEEVTSEQRSRAKSINFGIIYGMSTYGLAKQLNISNDESKQFIDKYFEQYPKIAEFMEDIQNKALEDGFVRTLFGRKRNIPNITSQNQKEKEQAKRMAINTPIQGTAADILKMALVLVAAKLQEENYQSKMIMQIHDEIVFEVVPTEEDKLLKMVKETMENVISLPIKLKVDSGIGENWLETK